MLLRLSILFALVATVGACTKESSTSAPSSPPVAAEPSNGLTRVEDPSLVCMVNNTFMGKPQIPVDIDGKTYFGCCPMCKDRLANEAETRSAVDPVSGLAVDKAAAVIAQDANGNVLYFASEDNLRNYRPTP